MFTHDRIGRAIEELASSGVRDERTKWRRIGSRHGSSREGVKFAHAIFVEIPGNHTNPSNARMAQSSTFDKGGNMRNFGYS